MVVDCPYCKKKNVSGRHPQLCGKNPNRRGIKKGGKHKNHRVPRTELPLNKAGTGKGGFKSPSGDDKTTGKNSVTITSPAAGSVFPVAPVESHSKILTEINLNKEFENMAEKFKGKTDEDKEKKYKYKCGECGEYFNLPAEGNKCPFCGV